ncbi:MAG: SH3 domain-containing protein [Candidatus Rifleibacteriota bacterium]
MKFLRILLVIALICAFFPGIAYSRLTEGSGVDENEINEARAEMMEAYEARREFGQQRYYSDDPPEQNKTEDAIDEYFDLWGNGLEFTHKKLTEYIESRRNFTKNTYNKGKDLADAYSEFRNNAKEKRNEILEDLYNRGKKGFQNTFAGIKRFGEWINSIEVDADLDVSITAGGDREVEDTAPSDGFVLDEGDEDLTSPPHNAHPDHYLPEEADQGSQPVPDHYLPEEADQGSQPVPDHYLPEEADQGSQPVPDHYLPEEADQGSQPVPDHYLPEEVVQDNGSVPDHYLPSVPGKVRVGGSVLRVRTTPWGEIVDHLADGADIKIIGEKDDWYLISHNGQQAYVHKNYVDTPEQDASMQEPVTDAPASESDPSDNIVTDPSLLSGNGTSQAALSWALNQTAGGNQNGYNRNNSLTSKNPACWNNWCLAFCATAYGRKIPELTAGSAIDSYYKFEQAGKIQHSSPPPAGAVLFQDKTGRNPWGHIFIATGETDSSGDPIIVTSGWPGYDGIHKITLSKMRQMYSAKYLGWALPN